MPGHTSPGLAVCRLTRLAYCTGRLWNEDAGQVTSEGMLAGRQQSVPPVLGQTRGQDLEHGRVFLSCGVGFRAVEGVSMLRPCTVPWTVLMITPCSSFLGRPEMVV
ncbi:hypothetical protein ACOMHN_006657 [Nucella lapillus]